MPWLPYYPINKRKRKKTNKRMVLVKVDIEAKDGTKLMGYTSARLRILSNTSLLSVTESRSGLKYSGYFLDERDEGMAQEALRALVRDASLDSAAFVGKKHATLYAYIDSYLTNRSTAFPVPRRRTPMDQMQIGLCRKRVYVDVCDTITQRSSEGRCISQGYGSVHTKPTEDVGTMSLRIDSRSLCSMKTVHFDPAVSSKRDGITTFLTFPSKEMQVMAYAFECNDSILPVIKIIMVDSKTMEIIICCDSDLLPESLKCTLIFDHPSGSISVSCKKGKYEYHPSARSLIWSVTPGEGASLTIYTTEPHRGSATLKYSYTFSKMALSSVIVNSLSSEAEENWIKHNTSVTGLLRTSE
jgi:hypothetical protein